MIWQFVKGMLEITLSFLVLLGVMGFSCKPGPKSRLILLLH